MAPKGSSVFSVLRGFFGVRLLSQCIMYCEDLRRETSLAEYNHGNLLPIRPHRVRTGNVKSSLYTYRIELFDIDSILGFQRKPPYNCDGVHTSHPML